MRHRSCLLLLLAAVLGCAVAACRREAPVDIPATVTGADKPADAVRLLTRHLHDNDLAAFARDAVPPELLPPLEQAWRDGRTRWPLTELPFDERLPKLLAALAEPGSEKKLQQVFDRQFSGADAELKAAAASLGLFGVQYIRSEGDYSDEERQHYAQFVQAISQWAMTAPLGDPQRARRVIPQLTMAARNTALASEADFRKAGLQDSLRRLGPFMAAVKKALAVYGLALDDSLAGLQATLQQQTGDRAQVRLQYTLGGSPIDTVVAVERRGGRWYLSDYLRHAEAAVATAAEPSDLRSGSDAATPAGDISAPAAGRVVPAGKTEAKPTSP
ncbi:hypothetical protein IP90_03128 [Luteimonas cucumeris]|uniref:Secreted protein n=1 Tax=Luteimonas cucumeris TaxID=985012 RepID=A0A562KVE7_9GAMM|nr:hypothetical protein [Luteimonas cucumeris]TWH99389.1 hypothetical protein IP90_03128 [Luteimonas cucumeris]